MRIRTPGWVVALSVVLFAGMFTYRFMPWRPVPMHIYEMEVTNNPVSVGQRAFVRIKFVKRRICDGHRAWSIGGGIADIEYLSPSVMLYLPVGEYNVIRSVLIPLDTAPGSYQLNLFITMICDDGTFAIMAPPAELMVAKPPL